jgi:hypothetical protein
MMKRKVRGGDLADDVPRQVMHRPLRIYYCEFREQNSLVRISVASHLVINSYELDDLLSIEKKNVT